MAPCGQRLQARRTCGDTRREDQSGFTTVNHGESSFEPPLRRVAQSDVAIVVQLFSGGPVLEIGRQMQRRSNRSRGIAFGAGVYRDRLELRS